MAYAAGPSLAEAERWLLIAGKLLEARDLVGCKKFVERAVDAYPLLDGADQIAAAAEVLQASQRRVDHNQLDWYAILHIDTSQSPGGPDLDSIRRAYRRLALLLRPDRNPYPSAAQAFKFVCDAWAFLSDPAKKRFYDDEVNISGAQCRSNGPEKVSDPPPPPPSFWTICAGCFRVYEYKKEYLGRTLRCETCRKPFQADELSTPPPIVPGTDLYYCSWGMFPLGFPGCPVFNGVVIPDGTTCIPAFPCSSSQRPVPKAKEHMEDVIPVRMNGRTSVGGTPPAAMTSKSPKKGKKVMAKRPRKQQQAARQPPQVELSFERGEGVEHEGNGDAVVQNLQMQNAHLRGGGAGTGHAGDFGGFDMNSFSIDIDATANVLGNLANLGTWQMFPP